MIVTEDPAAPVEGGLVELASSFVFTEMSHIDCEGAGGCERVEVIVTLLTQKPRLLKETFDLDLSPDLIYKITDAVLEEVRDWCDPVKS